MKEKLDIYIRNQLLQITMFNETILFFLVYKSEVLQQLSSLLQNVTTFVHQLLATKYNSDCCKQARNFTRQKKVTADTGLQKDTVLE